MKSKAKDKHSQKYIMVVEPSRDNYSTKCVESMKSSFQLLSERLFGPSAWLLPWPDNLLTITLHRLVSGLRNEVRHTNPDIKIAQLLIYHHIYTIYPIYTIYTIYQPVPSPHSSAAALHALILH